MKKVVLLVIVCWSFIACGSDRKSSTPTTTLPKQEEKPLSPEEQLKADITQKMATELKSAKKVLNIIAGFSFGMNADQVERHTMKMTGRKQLRKVKTGKGKVEYVYQLKNAKMKTDTYLDIEFHDGGLYKAICKAKTPNGAGASDFLNEVKNLFTEWYGAVSFQLPSYNSCDRYLWINGNFHLDLRCEVEGVTFVYTDLTSEQPNIDVTGNQLEIKKVNEN